MVAMFSVRSESFCGEFFVKEAVNLSDLCSLSKLETLYLGG